ncbi:MAG: hypothetical protein OXT49_02890 [Gammaproteobacteria bacterium]|nr:hypothetical protein [Gammaproteobacteria bacterium]
MLSFTDLSVGHWFKRTDGQAFEIVAIDAKTGAIEIQYFDGAIEEVEANMIMEDKWTAIAAPEDWSGSLDLERQDYGVDTGELYAHEWDMATPLDRLDMHHDSLY